MEKITLNGDNAGVVVEFDPSEHVQLSDGFYSKKDSNVTVVNGRYYRKNSPLIIKLSEKYYGPDVYAIKNADVIEDAEDGELIHIGDASSVHDFAIFSDSGQISYKRGRVYYSKSIALLKMVDASRRSYYERTITGTHAEAMIERGFISRVGNNYHKSDQVRALHPSYMERGNRQSHVSLYALCVNYGVYSFDEAISKKCVVEIDGYLHYYQHIEFSKDVEGNDYKPIKNISTRLVIDNRSNPYSSVRSLTPSARRHIKDLKSFDDLTKRSMVSSLTKTMLFKETLLDSDFKQDGFRVSKMGVVVSSKDDEELVDMLYEAIKSISSTPERCHQIISSSNWFGTFHQEPIPTMMSGVSIGNQGGDFMFNVGRKVNSISSDTKTTGGIGYTFGVELETEHGVVPYDLISDIGVDAVGDRSIGSLEYVTGILSGDLGMSHLMKIVDTVADYCTVADTCGVHVHIGGHSKTESPVFNKEFSVLSVMLGIKLEDEIFSLLPRNRRERLNSNGQSYCASIKDYSDITYSNWKDRLFHYVYGRLPEDTSEAFGGIKSLVDPRHRVGRWAQGRYKWLNLVNCLTDNSGRRNGGGFQTIEFRAFNGTLNRDDIKAFVLMSLAFTKFVETNKKIILSGPVNLEMVMSVLNEPCFEFMKKWISMRRKLISSVMEAKSPAKTKNLI